MTAFCQDNQAIKCEEAQLLIVPVWLNDPGFADRQRAAFQSHLRACSPCAEEYSETQWLMPLIIKRWVPISEGTRKLLEKRRLSGSATTWCATSDAAGDNRGGLGRAQKALPRPRRSLPAAQAQGNEHDQ